MECWSLGVLGTRHSTTPSLRHSVTPSLHHSITPSLMPRYAPLFLLFAASLLSMQRLPAQTSAPPATISLPAPQTNIVFVDLVGAARERSAALQEHLKAQGVLITGYYRLRFVTHLDVDAAGVDRAVAAVRRFFAL